MASADCGCCGQPTTAPEPVRPEEIEFDDCDCSCFDCDECGDCGDHGTVVVSFTPVVLCDDCDPDREECGEGAWHCDGRAGHSCDGTGCEEYANAQHPDVDAL